MSSSTIGVLLVMVVYLIFMLLVGVWFSRKNENAVLLLDKFNLINKIKWNIYDNKDTISPEEKEEAIAMIEYQDFKAIDAGYYERYYIFKSGVYSQHLGRHPTEQRIRLPH